MLFIKLISYLNQINFKLFGMIKKLFTTYNKKINLLSHNDTSL